MNNKPSANTVSCNFPYILFLLAFYMDTLHPAQKDIEVFMMLVCQGFFFFFPMSALRDLTLKRFSRGGKKCAG